MNRMRRHPVTLRLALQIAVLALMVHVVLPQLAGLRATGEALAHATWWLPLTLIALEYASLAAYGELVMVALRRAGARAPRSFVQRAVIVGSSLGRTLPGGTTAALAMVIAAFRRRGVEPVAATTAMATSGMLSTILLAALVPLAAVLTVLTGHIGSLALSALAVAGMVLVGAALTPTALRRPDALADRAGRWTQRIAVGPLRRHLDPAAVRRVVLQAAQGARALARDRAALRAAMGWATFNWLADMAVVVVLALTIGGGTPVAAIPLAYVVAQISASVPITPGGVGIVETAMIGTLVVSGAPGGAATATVLGWRLISHWLPIIAGLALLPTLDRPSVSQRGNDREAGRAVPRSDGEAPD
jgi:hypothetical protein